jgi:sulfite exporter TauE/SafE
MANGRKGVSIERINKPVSTWIAPFLIGLAGSLHCVGMCSPLVMAVSRGGNNAIFRNLQYNLGRILTYGILGSIVSLAGRGLHLAGLQQWISIIAGFLLFGVGIMSIRVALPANMQDVLLRFSGTLKNHFQQLLNRRNIFTTVLLGMINGLLPCGMTLVAMGYCITVDGPWDGFLAMVIFGAGTLPAMIGFASITRSLVGMLRVSYSTLQAGLIIVCAILLIGRGIWSDEISEGHDSTTSGIVVCGSSKEP